MQEEFFEPNINSKYCLIYLIYKEINIRLKDSIIQIISQRTILPADAVGADSRSRAAIDSLAASPPGRPRPLQAQTPVHFETAAGEEIVFK